LIQVNPKCEKCGEAVIVMVDGNVVGASVGRTELVEWWYECGYCLFKMRTRPGHIMDPPDPLGHKHKTFFTGRDVFKSAVAGKREKQGLELI